MAQVEPLAVIAEGERSRANDVNNRYPGTHHCLFFSTPLALGGLSSRDWVMCEAWRHSLFRCIILETMLAYSITLYTCNPLQLFLSRLTLWNGSWTSVDYMWRRNLKRAAQALRFWARKPLETYAHVSDSLCCVALHYWIRGGLNVAIGQC